MKRLGIALGVAAFLLLSLAIIVPLTGDAGSPCAEKYTVKQGDTLQAIGARFGVSVKELLDLNHLSGPDRIYATQVLCVKPVAVVAATPGPASATITPTAVTTVTKDITGTVTATPTVSQKQSSCTGIGCPRPHVNLVAEYQIDPSQDASGVSWTLGKGARAGKRLTFPLASVAALRPLTDTGTVRSESRQGQPLFWVVQNGNTSPFTYTLVAIGDPNLLPSLQITPTASITDLLGKLPSEAEISAATELGARPPKANRPVDVLGGNAVLTTTLRFELEAPNGMLIPTFIQEVDYQPSVEIAELVYDKPVFALQAPAIPGGQDYQLLFLWSSDGSGVPGGGWGVTCATWSGGGWIYQVVSSLAGC